MAIGACRAKTHTVSWSAQAFALGILASSLAGCASWEGLTPTGHPIESSTLQASRTLARTSLDTATWPATDWWRGLGDPQLHRLIDEALAGTPDLAIADAHAREAEAATLTAEAARGPKLDGNASAALNRRSNQEWPTDLGGGQNAFVKDTAVNLSWDLDLWGGNRATWEAAVGRAQAAEVDGRAARVELSTAIARAYARLGYAYARRDVATAELARAQNVLVLARQRSQSGIDDQLQVRRSEGDVATAEQQIAMSDQTIGSARIAMAILLGKGPDRGLEIARPHLLRSAAVAVPPNLPSDLIGQRADLVAARWRVEANSRDIDAAKADFLPNISISGLAGFSSLDAGSLLSASALTYRVGPAISLPLFDSGRRRANLANRDAAYDLAVAQYNKTLVTAVNTVADRLGSLRSLGKQVEAQQRAADAANAAWSLAETRYRAGIGSYLEVLSVRQQLLTAQERMAALHAEQVDLSLQLIEALGGGYRPDPQDRRAVAQASTRP
jgi:NodT family efflux transporter outer membrane factor (OMF) lipoprotein